VRACVRACHVTAGLPLALSHCQIAKRNETKGWFDTFVATRRVRLYPDVLHAIGPAALAALAPVLASEGDPAAATTAPSATT
jgi:hypothetical protein